MSQDPFAKPGGGGDLIDFNLMIGALLVVEVVELIPHIATVNTKAGEMTPAVRADVYVLDGPHGGEEYMDTLIFPKVMQSQLRRHVGSKVLGRVGQGQGKAGQSAPWTLIEATPADTAQAMAWLERQRQGSFAAPTQQDPWAQAQQAQQPQQGYQPQQQPPPQQQPGYQPRPLDPWAQPQGQGAEPPF